MEDSYSEEKAFSGVFTVDLQQDFFGISKQIVYIDQMHNNYLQKKFYFTKNASNIISGGERKRVPRKKHPFNLLKRQNCKLLVCINRVQRDMLNIILSSMHHQYQPDV
jgi:hypothetical protein